jgi:phosphatidyl-myo-inositol dimannoside synthase
LHLLRSDSRILMVVRNFPPLMGGMERFLHHVYGELCEGFQVALVGPAGCEDYVRFDSAVLACPALPASHFLACCQGQALRMAHRFRPDLIVAGSGLTAPAAKFAGLCFKVPVLCFLYGLDIVAPSFWYRWLFLPAIRRCTSFAAISQNTRRLALEAGIDASRMCILHPGVTIPPSQDMHRVQTFRDKIGAGVRPLLLSVGRLTQRKGIVEFIDQALPKIVNECPEALLVIIGHEPMQALTGSSGITHGIHEIAKAKNLTGHVRFLGRVDDETLWAAYAASQLFVFPVIEHPGDVEGFGMVAVEAAAHGLATVAFATGGVVDAVQAGVSGYLAASGDYRGFARLVLAHLRGSNSQVTTQTCMDFARRFSWDLFGVRLRKICEDVILQSSETSLGVQDRRNI